MATLELVIAQDFSYLWRFTVNIPNLHSSDGWIEVLSPDTALVKIIPQSSDDENSLIMRLFIDFAMTEALKNNTLQPYTTEMSEVAHELIDGVELEDESWSDGKACS